MIAHDSDLPVDVLLADPDTSTVDVYAPDVDANWASDYTSGGFDDATD